MTEKRKIIIWLMGKRWSGFSGCAHRHTRWSMLSELKAFQVPITVFSSRAFIKTSFLHHRHP